jgi:hypothetical protein
MGLDMIWNKSGDDPDVKDYSEVTPDPDKICDVCDKSFGFHGFINGWIVCPGARLIEVDKYKRPERWVRTTICI